MKDQIELPPLLPHPRNQASGKAWTEPEKEVIRRWGIDAIEADRQRRGEPVKEVELRPQDLSISSYNPKPRPQWMAHNDRGIRIVHLPTGIVTESHEERSPHRNREIALDKLRQQLAAEPAKVPSGVLSFHDGSLLLRADGSGYIAVHEDQFTLHDDRCEGPDGPQGSVCWIAEFPASEIAALRDFLNDQLAQSAASAEPVGEVFTMEALDGSGDVRSHVLLNKPLPAGTKLYAAPVAAQPTIARVPAATVSRKGGSIGSLVWTEAGRMADLPDGTMLYVGHSDRPLTAQPNTDEDAYVIDQMSKLLAEIAVIVRGPELPRHRHGYADLPERVAALKAASVVAQSDHSEQDLNMVAAQSSVLVPDGWKLVPIEPTDEQVRFAEVCIPKTPSAQYRAMITAAPSTERQ